MNLKSTTKDELEIVLNESKSLREVILKYGLSPNGSGGYRVVKNKIFQLGLKVPNYKHYTNHIPKSKRPNSEVFVENSNYSRGNIKKRIIKELLLKYECEICGNSGEHQNKRLSLQLDHKNGVNNDNRLENLRFLCPNCHSQTQTYGGKLKKNTYFCDCGNEMYKTSNKCKQCLSKQQRKVDRPSIEQLKEDVKNLGYSATGRKYGVSDNAIRKWLK